MAMMRTNKCFIVLSQLRASKYHLHYQKTNIRITRINKKKKVMKMQRE